MYSGSLGVVKIPQPPLLSVGSWLKFSLRSSSYIALQPVSKSEGAKIMLLGRSCRHIWPSFMLKQNNLGCTSGASPLMSWGHTSASPVSQEKLYIGARTSTNTAKQNKISHSIPWWSWVKQRYDSNQISVTAHKIFLRFNFHTSNKTTVLPLLIPSTLSMIFWFFSCLLLWPE